MSDWEQFKNSIKAKLDDITAVVIITAKADMTNSSISLDEQGKILGKNLQLTAQCLAMTRLELDGDIIKVIPGAGTGDLTREEIMNIHNQNVETALNNWKNFLDGIVEIIRIAAAAFDNHLPSAIIEENRFDNVRSATTYSIHPAQKSKGT